MALKIATEKPNGLLNKIKAAIDEGTVKTWRYIVHDGNTYFTHTTNDKQWDGKAWLKPTAENGQLRFNIIPPETGSITTTLYGIFHGRFLEMLLTHFDVDFSSAVASAMAEYGDVMKGNKYRAAA